MTQTTRACTECGAEVKRTNPVGSIRAQCSDNCRRARHRRIRPEQPKTSKPCETCGSPVLKSAECTAFRKYCSEECRPTCVVEGCPEPGRTRGWCGNHYVHWKKTGDPLKTVLDMRPAPAKTLPCTIDGCNDRQRKRGWCEAHYNSWYNHGDPLAKVKRWSKRAVGCRVCGRATVRELRNHCSQACWAAEARAARKGVAPAVALRPCHVCGAALETVRRNGKAVRRRDTLICKGCRQRAKHGITAESLAEEHGTSCGICGYDVDMALRAPHRMRASVDHIVPYAWGGGDDRSNLQLCHLLCNWIKGARTIAA